MSYHRKRWFGLALQLLWRYTINRRIYLMNARFRMKTAPVLSVPRLAPTAFALTGEVSDVTRHIRLSARTIITHQAAPERDLHHGPPHLHIISSLAVVCSSVSIFFTMAVITLAHVLLHCEHDLPTHDRDHPHGIPSRMNCAYIQRSCASPSSMPSTISCTAARCRSSSCASAPMPSRNQAPAATVPIMPPLRTADLRARDHVRRRRLRHDCHAHQLSQVSAVRRISC